MAISVFVSSTSQNLGTDCRPKAIRAIREYPAIAIVMEDWTTAFEDAVIVCKRKLEKESDHYLGIFAYRHGMVRPELGKSITQAEFEWACNKMKPHRISILMPDLRFSFGQELYERAIREQTPADTAAQEAFLKAVKESGRVCMMFDDLAHVSQKVTRQLSDWVGQGIFDEAERADANATVASSSAHRRRHRPANQNISYGDSHGYERAACEFRHRPEPDKRAWY
jgi:hypothetical protein